MKEKKYTGFESYLVTHEITEDFINDFNYWCKRVFFQWKKLNSDLDTFYEACWEALLVKLPEFDPSIATIQTFCISRINNEAWRFYNEAVKVKKRGEVDYDSDVIKGTLCCPENPIPAEFEDFRLYCLNMGVEIDLEAFYSDYIESDKNGEETAPMVVYTWWQNIKHILGERNDISQRWG